MSFFFFFNDTATTEIYTLSLHDALPICERGRRQRLAVHRRFRWFAGAHDHCRRRGGIGRSEEHTSELQSPCNLVCRLLLEKKKNEQRKTVRRLRDQQPYSQHSCIAHIHS